MWDASKTKELQELQGIGACGDPCPSASSKDNSHEQKVFIVAGNVIEVPSSNYNVKCRYLLRTNTLRE